ncbi:hypothetical protein [Paeniglutamicibacter cryotolerans]|uniref:Purine-cytosine permease-like protein n=1 Tax=Paeniglutamicibacter cryotolerans TaxID=670079 RepID=A0A839QEV3_9MICC|nr:hypothetical protein [Paeniglutamicibacter cryotolerans]MBB2994143.1 purine-cytosine permease-like protein [Paeniglutamicibacter cryotolerans]
MVSDGSYQEDLASALGTEGCTLPTFLLSISLSAGWQMPYGPYGADYSRYLLADTPERRTFFACFCGSVTGAQWAMTLGALFAAIAMPAGQSFLENQVGFVGNLADRGALAILTYIVIMVRELTVNTLNS